jgi:tRNA pseudouridine38-40 synthase
MVEGINLIKQYKDLSSLAKAGDYIRKEIDLRELKLYFDGKIITIEITASHFLRNMVRRIVGHLVALGRGSLSLEELKDIIEKKSPSHGKFTAPAEGLYLKTVYY